MLQVLLVDDEPFILQGLKVLVDWKAEGYEIATASNGREALDFILNNHVDLVISDIKMPVMSGLELLTELREKHNKDTWFVKIILLCFLIHWVARKLFPDVLKQNIFMIVLIMFYIVVTRKMGVKLQWYTTLACYPVGCVIARPTVVKSIVDFLREKKTFSFVIFTILTLTSVILSHKSWVFIMVAPIVFSLACYYFSYIFETKNKFLAWVGNNSFEFYIFHYIFLQGLEKLFEINRYAYAVSVVGCSLVTIYIYLLIRDKITKK